MTLKVTPERTALKALKKSIGSYLLINSFHLLVSKPQFTNISKNTKTNPATSLAEKSKLNSEYNFLRSYE
jgi:hypothetical protein